MRLLRNVPIRRKLTLITMVTTVLALALACAAFTIFDQLILRRDLVNDLSTTAEMVGFNSSSALSFNDPDSAQQTLKSLAAQPHITAGCVYGRDGRVFATYYRSGEDVRAFSAIMPPEGHVFSDETLGLLHKINFDGENIGAIYLRSDLSELRDRLALCGMIFAAVTLGVGGIAYLVISRLQRVISEPITQLAAVAGRVAAESNYSVRAKKEGDDEVGALIDGFNEMLAQIQARDAELQRAHDDLEKRVEERTRELSAEVGERRRTETERDRVFTLSLDYLCIITFDGLFRRINPALQNTLGQSMENLTSTQVLQFIHPDDRKDTYIQLRRLKMGASVVRFENRVRCADGTYRWVEWSGIPDRDQNCFYSYGRDVTELKLAQERSTREQARLQFIFESVPVGISLRHTRPDGRRTRLINDAHLRICGIDRVQVDEPEIFQRISHKDDYARQVVLNRQVAAREINGYTIDKRYVRPNGDIVWVTFSIQRHDYPDGSFEELSTIVDITALKQAEEHVAREQARFKFIFDSVPVGICLDHVPVNGERNRVLNHAHLRICGLTREEAAIGAFQRITHPDDYAQQDVLRRQLEAGLIGRFSLEKRYLRSDGDTVWVAYSVQRQRFPDGSHQDLSTIVDITEVKRAQLEVARERARFKFIFESVPVGISLVEPGNEENHVVNPAHERITGISRERLHEPGIFERVTHPDDYAAQKDIVQRYKEGLIDRFSLEKRYLHADGRIVWAALTRRMFIDPATGQKQSITTVIDISDVKAAQEEVTRERARFKFIFEAVPVGISMFSPGELESVVVNPAHVRITGVSDADSRIPGAFQRVSHPEDFRRQMEFAEKLVRGDIEQYSVEKRYLHSAGRIVWAVLSTRMFMDAGSGKRQAITTIVDITERKDAEAKLAETHKQLLDSSRQAGMAEVATGVLHNVGNVLNSVNVSTTLLTDLVRQSKVGNVVKLADLLAEQADLGQFFTADPRGQRVPGFVKTLSTHLTREQHDLLTELESLRKNVEHIKEIVAMQQSYAKVSGVSEIVSVVDLVEDALRMNSGAFARHDVSLVRDFQVNPSVTLEKHKVLQILVNLMRNAKYACDDSGRSDKQILIRVFAEASRVKIAIVDNGVGIPPENLTRIFSHGFTTRKHGHGFGLHSGAIAAKELGGALIAQSEGRGHGATFILELPLTQEAKAA